MTIERIVRIVAGFMVLLSLALTHYVHPNWIFLTLFVGANLLQSGFTNFCPLVTILRRMGVREA
uniref:Inner membrane protein YgaP-like transmembrane domain-containing protein n=1 Tax=Magnetococcus massalia (strain MO-1) TaxID=451514 RepID=A0A1S7LIB7_MAGMO|nr:conserved protein of unknown function [Candidatus Magnetococcus massalia]